MKKTFLLIVMGLIINCMFSISGNISTDTIWETDQIVTGNIIINEGVTLTIMPGVKVKFTKIDANADNIGDTYIKVLGRLNVQGTAANKVIFTSYQPNPMKSDWWGIKYETPQSGNLSTITNAEFHYAYEGFYLSGRNVTFNNVSIDNSGSYGMRINNTFLTSSLTNCVIEENNSYGLLIEAGTVNITGLTLFKNGDYGLKILEPSTVTATDIVSSTNQGEGIWSINDQDASFTNCRAISNINNGVWLDGASATFTNCDISNNSKQGVLIEKAAANPTITHSTIRANKLNGVEINNATATITYCSIISNRGVGLFLDSSMPIVNNCNIYQNMGSVKTINFPNYGSPGAWQVTYPYTEYLPQLYFDQLINYSIDQYFIPLSIIYKKDGDNYNNIYSSIRSYRNYSKITLNNTIFNDEYFRSVMGTGSFDMPEYTVNVNNKIEKIYSRNNIGLNILNSENCPNARAWVTQLTAFFTNSSNGYSQAVVWNGSGTSTNLQNNWWGQINGVDSLITQRYAGTASYQTLETQPVQNAGANLNNLVPTFQITSPATMQINPTSCTINWTDRDLDDNAMISLYYTEDPSQTGNLIVANLEEDCATNSYTWNLTGLPNGTYFIKGVINDGVNSPVTAVSSGRVMIGALKMYMPSNATGVAGTSVSIPVKTINTVEYFNIIAFQFTLTYNNNILTATGFDTDGTMTGEDWTVNANTSTPGQITVNGFSTHSLTHSGALLKIVFNVNQTAVNYSTSPLNFADFTLNNGTPTATLENGLFKVVNQYNMSGNVNYFIGVNKPISGVIMKLTGDLTSQTVTDQQGNYAFPPTYAGNYVLTPKCYNAVPEAVVTPYDAALTAQYAINLYTFTNNQIKAADADGNGSATVYDAALIAQYAVGLVDSLSVGKWGFTPASKSFNFTSNINNDQFLGFAIGDPSGNCFAGPAKSSFSLPIVQGSNYNGQISIPVSYSESFCSYYAKFQYDQTKIRYIGVSYNACLDGYQKLHNVQDGMVTIGGFSTIYTQNPDIIYNMIFETIGSCENLENLITIDLVCFDENPVDIHMVSVNDETVELLDLQLKQNYPNPFNPQTTISYYLPKAERVTLSVYNIKGQLVKTLVNEVKNAGLNKTIFEAKEFSSGIYYYRIKTNNHTITRKMVLMK